MLTDLQLLSRYHSQGDATAFQDLVRAHASMVFATARRVTRDDAMAEDVVQETFFQLARQSRHITQSVAAWLHRVAWRRACNAVRDDSTRRRIEEEAAATEEAVQEPSGDEMSWAEVEKELDAALDELPDDLRGPLVMHFLQGRSQRDIATQAGVSQSTISRAVEEGLSILRGQLKKRGVLCGAGLASLLMTNQASAAPAALLVSLGKISLTGAGATTMAPVAAAAIPWVKTAVAATLIAGGSWVLMHREAPTPVPMPPDVVSIPSVITQQLGKVPTPRMDTTPLAIAPVKAGEARAEGKPNPVHELIHSFPTPPKIPTGHLVLDDEGWIWGVTSSGGRYGVGTVYRMRPDGGDWEEMVSFNGNEGVPRGGYPSMSLVRAPDGRFWGATAGSSFAGTLFCVNPRTGSFSTEIEFSRGEMVEARPALMPDGSLWFSTSKGVYHYDPATRSRKLVKERTRGKETVPPLGEFVADGLGWLWAASERHNSHGCLCKLNPATGEFVTVLRFTGKEGAFPGSVPYAGLTLASDGYFWGTTRNGGKKDTGTIFKLHPQTHAFTSVAHFEMLDGMNPESMLQDDGRGFMWGTATYGAVGGSRGHGSIFKVERSTGRITSVVRFTGYDGAAPGGIPRAHLLRAGPDHFVGVTNFWGAGWSGVIYRVDISTGKYSILKDLAELATTTEGVEPHGTLIEGTEGVLWGTTFYHGAHHGGTVYKLDSASQQLVSVVDFTGKEGPFPGRSPDAGLVRDGRGYLWGTTRFGGKADAGTVFKLHEETGAFTSVLEFGPSAASAGMRGGYPMTEMTLDERGQIWGVASTTIFKIDPVTHAAKTIGQFGGDVREPHGSELGRLVADGKGNLWGCALGSRTTKKATLFRIRTRDDVLEPVSSFANALAGWSGWHPSAQMHQDTAGSIWFTGVLDQGGARPHCSLNRLDPVTGQIVAQHFSPAFSIIDTPVDDGHGRLWGATAQSGIFGSLFTFDLQKHTFSRALEFTGHGSQPRSGGQPSFGRPMRASDGNIYSVTRYGGPGNGGTIYRLRFGPCPMTQQAVVLADGRVELHGILKPNGRDSLAAFEYGTDPLLKDAKIIEAGAVRSSEVSKSVQAVISDLPGGVTHYFRLRGINPDNAVPQRGAVLQFIIPKESSEEAKLASPDTKDDEAAISAAAASPKHRLKVIMIPGAGAGIVRGRLQSAAYEIGKTYSLTAHADNRYVFASWSGPGISGAQAENPKLDFIFTEELARKPVLTATFVLNPFHEALLGVHHGLARPGEGMEHSTATSGALEMQIEDLGYFQGVLRYDGDEMPFDGVFDTGGSARFGDALAFIGTLQRPEKPALLLSLSLDMSADGPGGVHGQVGTHEGENAVWKSQVHAPLSLPPTKLASDPAVQHLTSAGSLPFEIIATGSGEKMAAQLLLQPDGRLGISTKLPDGTDVLGSGHLSPASRLTFFHPLKGEKPGSLGLDVLLSNLLQAPSEPDPSQQGWWQPAGRENQFLMLQSTPAEKEQ